MGEAEGIAMWRWKGMSGPMLKSIFRAQIGERGCKKLNQLPGAVYDRLPRTSQTIAVLCVELDVALAAFDLYDCERVVLALARQLCEMFGAPRAFSREVFLSFGGDGLLLRVLFCPFENHHEGEKGSLSMTRVWSLQKDCLDILRELCSTVPFFAESLATHRDYLIKCFSLMAIDVAFDSAVFLAEEILAVRDEILDLREVDNFANLVQNFSSKQLVLFCRILAMVVFEPEAPKVVTGLQPYVSSEAETSCSIADLNHELILSIPGILSRLLKLLYHYRLPHSSRGRTSTEALLRRYFGTSNNGGEDIAFARMLLNTSRLLNDHPAELDIDSEVDIGSVDTAIDIAAMMAIPAPEIFTLANQVEILFVLCALCGSMKRDQVQNTLAELGLVEVLSQMFEQLDWTTSRDSAKPRGVHGHGCACNRPVALKIQYLRLIHNFCDRDSCNKINKHLLFNSAAPLCKGSNSTSDQPSASDGLMVKIVKVLMNEPADSMFRSSELGASIGQDFPKDKFTGSYWYLMFWLASCVEAFLRGADVQDQATLASTGLMEHLLGEILKGGFSCASSLQINFDLLGELIKFNHVLFAKFSRLLDGDKFHRFVEVLVTNLVDSNVFIRSVLLSLESFRNCWQLPCKGHRELQKVNSPIQSLDGAQFTHERGAFLPGARQQWHDEEWCQMESFILHNKFRLLRDLMSAVPLHDVNQDNICVINTALIMFILAERNGVQLQTYLQALKTGENSGGTSDGYLLQKFRQLLKFWQRYYFRKTGRDSLSLQYSTNIPFEEWLRVVNLLCNDPEPSIIPNSSPSCESHCTGISMSSESSSRRC